MVRPELRWLIDGPSAPGDRWENPQALLDDGVEQRQTLELIDARWVSAQFGVQLIGQVGDDAWVLRQQEERPLSSPPDRCREHGSA